MNSIIDYGLLGIRVGRVWAQSRFADVVLVFPCMHVWIKKKWD